MSKYYLGNSLYVSDKATNGHVSITGISGSGKTTLLNRIELNLAKQNATMVIAFNFNSTHDIDQILENYRAPYQDMQRCIDVEDDGIPFHLFDPTADRSENIDNILTVFTDSAKLGPKQRRTFQKVVEEIVCELENGIIEETDILERINREFDKISKDKSIPSDERKSCNEISLKVAFITERMKINPNISLEKGKINILNIRTRERSNRNLAVDFILGLIWNAAQTERSEQSSSRTPMVIFLDEYHDLNFTQFAPLTTILREGRKFGLSLILSTQGKSAFSKNQRSAISQAATHIYFQQALSDVNDAVKDLAKSKAEKDTYSHDLPNLPVGVFYVKGKLTTKGGPSYDTVMRIDSTVTPYKPPNIRHSNQSTFSKEEVESTLKNAENTVNETNALKIKEIGCIL